MPEPDYRSEITDLSSKTVSSSAIELWWNNTNTEDTGYEIFVSGLPETGYTPLKTVGVGVENKAVISGLSPDTTYYYKIRPVRGDKTGTMSDYTSVRTSASFPRRTNLRVPGEDPPRASRCHGHIPMSKSLILFITPYSDRMAPDLSCRLERSMTSQS